MKVVAINDSNRPNDIRSINWIEKDKIYTVVETFNYMGQKAYALAEVQPDPPYFGYLANRFRLLSPEEEISEVNVLELAL